MNQSTMADQTINRPVRILIVNLHSSHNAGDAALTLVAIQQLRDSFPNSQITLAMNDPASHQVHQHGEASERVIGSFVRFVQPIAADGHAHWNLAALFWLPLSSLLTLFLYRLCGRVVFLWLSPAQQALLRAYLEADLVVSSPGNFLYSSGTVGLPFLLSIFAMAFAVVAGKPLYTLPQSIGPLKRWWEHLLVRWILQRTRIVMIREPASLVQLRRAGLTHPRCSLSADLAFAFAGEPATAAHQWLTVQGINPDADRPLLGVTLINWSAQSRGFTHQDAYEDAVAAAVRFFLYEYGGKAILFPQVCGPAAQEDDRIPARRVAHLLQREGARVVMIEQPVPPALLQAVYGCMDMFIGTRMHSNIFALTGHVPVVAIGYRLKTEGIMRMLGLERTTIPIEQVDTHTLVSMLQTTWAEREALRNHIATRVAHLAEQARASGDMIASDWHTLQQQSSMPHRKATIGGE